MPSTANFDNEWYDDRISEECMVVSPDGTIQHGMRCDTGRAILTGAAMIAESLNNLASAIDGIDRSFCGWATAGKSTETSNASLSSGLHGLSVSLDGLRRELQERE